MELGVMATYRGYGDIFEFDITYHIEILTPPPTALE